MPEQLRLHRPLRLQQSGQRQWNRYSYVGNDPLAFTDPNGFGFWSWISHAFSSAWHGITNFFSHNAIARAIAQVVIATAVAIASGGNVVLAAQVSAFVVTGLSGGNLGQMLKASVIAGATAFAFSGLPVVPAFGADFNPVAYAGNVAGSALIGCASSAASGGSCGSGAAAAAVSAGLAPATGALFPNAANDIGQRIGGTIIQATAGGVASVAGGGKFANGAATAAFQYQVALGPVTSRESATNDPGNANAMMDEKESGKNLPILRIGPDPSKPLERLVYDIAIAIADYKSTLPYTFSETVLNNVASRPYINSPLLIDEIRAVGTPTPDPQGAPGLVRYDVPGGFKTTPGTWQLVINPVTNRVYHFQFKKD